MKISLYIHFPFCLQKCLYCDFNSLAGSGIGPQEYIAAVVREMELRAATLDGPVAAPTLYFGGGTPSLMEPGLVARVTDAAARLFGLETDAEITIEANPGTLTPQRLAGFRGAGVNRLSLGVQSFNDRLLARLGRIHSAREARDSFAAARDAGFANIGIDLIHSLPEETITLWRTDLLEAVALAPEHVSAYGLTVEEGTPFHDLSGRGELPLPEEEESLLMFEETASLLAAAGYEHYEISNFALPGYRSRHNQVYWRRAPYLGFGAGAHSFSSSPRFGVRWHNAGTPGCYLEILGRGALPEEERVAVTEREARSEFLFLGLRMREGVEEGAFRQAFGLSLEEAYPGEVAELVESGLMERVGGWLRLTERGVAVANQVFMRFI